MKTILVAVLITLLMACGIMGQTFVQQGPKLVGSGAAFTSLQGRGVAVSADGNTTAVGGAGDNFFTGAVWVFTRSGGVWTQQGTKLVGSGATLGQIGQGGSVAISADGNTLIDGGVGDDSGTGAVWVFVRSGGVWTQQGTKLVGTGALGAGAIFQGTSVALSADGNTAIVGGSGDNSGAGAAWVFIRSGGVWTQQTKLVGTGATGAASQGTSVSLSSDGNTAIVGGPDDGFGAGATWVFTRTGGVWTQQGNRLIGTGASGSSRQGTSVSISADGNTLFAGGPGDASNVGAAWVFVRSGSVWTQQGSKLVGSGAGQPAQQGSSVSLSGNGNTAFVGGPDDTNPGATWVFTRLGTVWSQQGSKLAGIGGAGIQVGQGASVSLSTDGNTAIVGGPGDNTVGAAWIFVLALPADLAITKTSNPAGPNPPDSPTTYTITVTNSGPGASDGVTVTDALPPQVTFVSATPSQGSCSGTTVVTCTLAALANGASATIIVAVTTGSTIGPVSNTATVTATTSDLNQANNSSTTAFNIVGSIPTITPGGLLILALALAIAGAFALRS